MIPAAFDYAKAGSADEALSLLAEHGDEAKLLAGGHSLLPLMKLRLASPAMLIDIGPIKRPVVRQGRRRPHRHRRARRATATSRRPICSSSRCRSSLTPPARSAIRRCVIAARSAARIAHSDPASDLPAVVLALGGTMVAQVEQAASARSRRLTSSPGFLESALAPDELLTEIRVPKVAGAGWSFQKFNRRAQDWAIVGVAARAATARRASHWSTWARRRCAPAPSSRPSPAVRRRPTRRSTRPRARRPQPTSTRASSTASTSPGCSCAAPSRKPAPEPVAELDVVACRRGGARVGALSSMRRTRAATSLGRPIRCRTAASRRRRISGRPTRDHEPSQGGVGAAVDLQRDSGEVLRLFGAEERDDLTEVAGVADGAARDAARRVGGVAVELDEPRGGVQTREDRVHGDAVLRDLSRERAQEARRAGARGVRQDQARRSVGAPRSR